MKLSEELVWRGFVSQHTFKDLKELDGQTINFYWGADPSSDSLTIGNLAPAMMIRHFIDHGHNAFLLIGGATGLIGDPKDEERIQKSEEEIKKNKESIKKQYDTIFKNKNYQIVDNYDWFKDIKYLDFLRDIGKNVPLSSMLGREFVQSRLGNEGSGISYAEFSYSLIQGYDFLHLFKNHAVTLQLCGSDQWGNVVAGLDLIRRKESGEANALSMPLIVNKNTGVKFGKSEAGAIWLDQNKTSVYSFYQFWLNVDDESVIDYLKIYTMLSKDKIDLLEKSRNENPENREAQKTLAHQVTSLIHGDNRAESVRKVIAVLFDNEDLETLSSSELDILSQEIPKVSFPNDILNALIESTLCSSKNEAKRLLEGRAVSVSGKKITENYTLDKNTLIKVGKNRFILVRQ